MYDAIIIGAGMSGLAAGIRLAMYDRRVCLLEKHYTIGGLNSFYRLRGRDYDVGLHAVTNFTPKGARTGPLARLLRQLRFSWDDFALAPQCGSAIAFPGVTLAFDNGLERLSTEVAAHFPDQRDRFAVMVSRLIDYDDLSESNFHGSARKFLAEHLSDPLLCEMLLCPLMWYGNAREHDMDLGQFCIMFRSIFCEGFARPAEGVRLILRKLVKRYRERGGELRLRCGVKQVLQDGGRAVGVELESGEQLLGRKILSSAGWAETLRLCGAPPPAEEVGRMTFTEIVSTLDCPPGELGLDRTIVFFNDGPRFDWRRSDDWCDLRTGVICSPNNYRYEDAQDAPAEGVVRVTSIASYDRWSGADEAQYRNQKAAWQERILDSAVRFAPDWRSHAVDHDMFTPRTIERFTSHLGGAVYGAVRKRLGGETPLENLHLCGTDQGFVGIIGAIFSGISMANRHVLQTSL